MANKSIKFLAVTMVVVLLASSVSGDQLAQCIGYFDGLGGQNEVSQMVPSCQQGFMGFRGCCAEVKAVVNAGPSGCLCDATVWNKLVETIEAAGIDGLNRDSLDMFSNMCGIAHYGGSGC